METDVGHAAGRVWSHLNEHGAATVAELKRDTKLPETTLLMAIGWLAREGKLELTQVGRTLRILLKPE